MGLIVGVRSMNLSGVGIPKNYLDLLPYLGFYAIKLVAVGLIAATFLSLAKLFKRYSSIASAVTFSILRQCLTEHEALVINLV